MEDLISVVVAVYNIENYIGKCIESIIGQTYKNLEIILVDDGANDNSGSICEKYAELDKRIVVIHKENGGLSDARNKGIERSNGKYILIVDGDDYIEKEMIEVMHDKIVTTSADLCICGISVKYENVSDDGNLPRIDIKSGIFDKGQMYHKIVERPNWYYVVAWNKLYKKELFEKVRYPKGKINEDEFVIHKILEQCEKTVVIDKKLYNYVQRQNSIMHKGYKVKQLDIVEALGNRAEFFFDIEEREYANIILDKMRTTLIYGYVALRNQKADGKKERIHELYLYYRRLMEQTHFEGISLKNKLQMIIMEKSLVIGVLCSNIYWENRRENIL